MDDADPRYTFTLKTGLKLQVLLTAILSLSFSNPLLALDCVLDHFTLTSQAQVDSFVADYGTCDHIVGVLNIYSGPFTDLDGLENIVSVGGSLVIGKYEQARVSIASLSGLENLQTVTNEFAIQTTSTLSSLSPLSSLTTVGTLTIRDSTAISSLDGLGNINGDLEYLEISSLPLLTNLNGLPGGLGSVNTFQIFRNDALQNLDGLPAMSNVAGFSISRNLALENITALTAISFRNYGVPFEAPGIIIANNPLLGSLSGIPPVTALSSLVIGRNTSITNLDELDGLLEVWGLVSVRENTNLSDCSVLKKVMDDVDDGFPGPNDSNPDFPPDVDWNAQSGEGMLGLNAPGCNTIEQIVGTGSGEEVFIDGFEGN